MFITDENHYLITNLLSSYICVIFAEEYNDLFHIYPSFLYI